MKHELISFLVGLVLGGILVAWLSWTYLHAKFDAFEQSIHARFEAFQTAVAAHFHKGPSSVAPAESAPSASPVTPAQQ